jgi:Bacterial DNA-binding protein
VAAVGRQRGARVWRIPQPLVKLVGATLHEFPGSPLHEPDLGRAQPVPAQLGKPPRPDRRDEDREGPRHNGYRMCPGTSLVGAIRLNPTSTRAELTDHLGGNAVALTQSQLVTAVADRAELTKSDARRALAALEEVVLEELGNAQKVRIGGLYS